MGRWRSGAPLVLAPEKDDPELGRRHAAKQRLQLQGDGSARLCGPARLAHSPDESSRHAAQHEPAPDDPARRAVRASFAGRRARRRGRARDRRLRHLREPHPPVRVRAERLGKRPELQRARQRTRPDHRRPRRNAGVQDSQAAHSQENRRLAGLHHGQGRRVLLSPGPQGAWLSRVTERNSAGPESQQGQKGGSYVSASFRPDLQSGSHSAQIHAGQAAHKHLLDVELSLGGAARPCGDGEPILDHDRGSARRSGRPTRRRNGAQRSSFRASRERSSCFTARPSASRRSPAKRRAIRSPSSSASTRPATGCRSTNAFSPTPTR